MLRPDMTLQAHIDRWTKDNSAHKYRVFSGFHGNKTILYTGYYAVLFNHSRPVAFSYANGETWTIEGDKTVLLRQLFEFMKDTHGHADGSKLKRYPRAVFLANLEDVMWPG